MNEKKAFKAVKPEIEKLVGGLESAFNLLDLTLQRFNEIRNELDVDGQEKMTTIINRLLDGINTTSESNRQVMVGVVKDNANAFKEYLR